MGVASFLSSFLSNVSRDWQHFAGAFLATIGQAAVRSLVLASVAGFLLAVCRVKNVALRLSAWKLVLWGALAMPLLVWLVPPVPFALPAVVASQVARFMPVQAANADGPSVADAGARTETYTLRVAPNAYAHAATASGSAHRARPMHDDSAAAATIANASDDQTYATVAVHSSAAPFPARMRISATAIAIGIYVFMVVLLMSRLVIGWILGRRLIRGSRAIRDPRATLSLSLRAFPSRIQEAPVLAESEAVTVPVTLGVARPVILLPDDWREWDDHTLNAVLAHELSHIGRNDALTQRLSQLHRAAYWFSPLAWWLDREIARLAEEASDEAALASGADRQRYAETLLGFFEAVRAGSGRVWWQGVSMAARGDAAERVDRILSWKGAVSMRLQKTLAVALGVVALPALCATASIHFTARAGQAPSKPTAPTAAPSPASAPTPAAAPSPASAPTDDQEPTPPAPATPEAAPTPEPAPAPRVLRSKPIIVSVPEIYIDQQDVHVPQVRVAPVTVEVPTVNVAPVAALAGVARIGPAVQQLAQARVALSTYATALARVAPTVQEWQGRGSNATFWVMDDTNVRDPYIISAGGAFIGVMNHSVWVDDSGDTDDLRWAKRLRNKVGGDYIWFEHDGQGYVIRDRATIDRAMALYQPIRELSKQQEELGRQQEALGAQQEALGNQMEQVTVKIPDMSAEVDHIKERMHDLAAKGGTQDELGDLQGELGELQSRIGEIQSQAGREESKIGRQQGELGRKQGDLGRRQGEVGRKEGELSRQVQKQMEGLLDESRTKGLAKQDDAAQRD